MPFAWTECQKCRSKRRSYFTDDEGEGLTGRGETEVEALRDLCEKLRNELLDHAIAERRTSL